MMALHESSSLTLIGNILYLAISTLETMYINMADLYILPQKPFKNSLKLNLIDWVTMILNLEMILEGGVSVELTTIYCCRKFTPHPSKECLLVFFLMMSILPLHIWASTTPVSCNSRLNMTEKVTEQCKRMCGIPTTAIVDQNLIHRLRGGYKCRWIRVLSFLALHNHFLLYSFCYHSYDKALPLGTGLVNV